MLTKHELETAIKVCHHEIMKLTHETIRPNQGFKMRMHAPSIAGIIATLDHYEAELAKLEKEAKPVVVTKGDKS